LLAESELLTVLPDQASHDQFPPAKT
jgi:hypothetical protein